MSCCSQAGLKGSNRYIRVILSLTDVITFEAVSLVTVTT